MATERNPFDRIPEEETNVVPLAPETEDIDATFEVAEDGGVIVDFSENVEMMASEDIAEWYGNMAEDMDEDDLVDIANDVIEKFEGDKDFRGGWGSFFLSGFFFFCFKIKKGFYPFFWFFPLFFPLFFFFCQIFSLKNLGKNSPFFSKKKKKIRKKKKKGKRTTG